MKSLIILLFIFLTSISYSQNKFTLRFELNFTGDTVHYERISHYFEPVKIITTNIQKSIDSLNRVRFEILDSLERDRMSKAFTLYYKDSSDYFAEFDPSDEFIKLNNIKLKDSCISEYNTSLKVLGKLFKFRGNEFDVNFSVNENLNYDWVEDSKYELVDYYKLPVMIFDDKNKSNCDCVESIAKNILNIRKYKRLILSKKTKNISVSIFSTNKNKLLVYMKFDRNNKCIKHILIINQ
jgi:hypothetical protein